MVTLPTRVPDLLVCGHHDTVSSDNRLPGEAADGHPLIVPLVTTSSTLLKAGLRAAASGGRPRPAAPSPATPSR
jgi:hypothetical protein